mmetsp:Transcript_39020/g.97679  ORF Transcript_39020/g.97679 Transcript_39020/m.97679 type:complete len:111 (-) Transcript_39020:996-1328(-)
MSRVLTMVGWWGALVAFKFMRTKNSFAQMFPHPFIPISPSGVASHTCDAGICPSTHPPRMGMPVPPSLISSKPRQFLLLLGRLPCCLPPLLPVPLLHCLQSGLVAARRLV